MKLRGSDLDDAMEQEPRIFRVTRSDNACQQDREVFRRGRATSLKSSFALLVASPTALTAGKSADEYGPEPQIVLHTHILQRKAHIKNAIPLTWVQDVKVTRQSGVRGTRSGSCFNIECCLRPLQLWRQQR